MTQYGGQAVIEGVMMRGPSNWAVAVRRPNGEIAEVSHSVQSVMRQHRLLRLPIVRGCIALGESLAIGARGLTISTRFAAEDPEVGIELGKWTLAGIFAFAAIFAISLFKVGPALLTDLLPIKSGAWFVIVEGTIRVAVLVAYMTIISLMPSLRRVFEYHGAEHKVVHAFENKAELTPVSCQRFSTLHPRCGTAFLLWVMVIAIFVYAFFGRLTWYWLIVTRIAFLPLIAGLAYELILFTGQHQGNRLVSVFIAPGLWLQRLTTRPPSLDQLEVSIAAFTKMLALEHRSTASEKVEVLA